MTNSDADAAAERLLDAPHEALRTGAHVRLWQGHVYPAVSAARRACPAAADAGGQPTDGALGLAAVVDRWAAVFALALRATLDCGAGGAHADAVCALLAHWYLLPGAFGSCAECRAGPSDADCGFEEPGAHSANRKTHPPSCCDAAAAEVPSLCIMLGDLSRYRMRASRGAADFWRALAAYRCGALPHAHAAGQACCQIGALCSEAQALGVPAASDFDAVAVRLSDLASCNGHISGHTGGQYCDCAKCLGLGESASESNTHAPHGAQAAALCAAVSSPAAPLYWFARGMAAFPPSPAARNNALLYCQQRARSDPLWAQLFRAIESTCVSAELLSLVSRLSGVDAALLSAVVACVQRLSSPDASRL